MFLVIFLIGCSAPAVSSDEDTSFIYPPWRHTWGVTRATPLKLRLFVGNATRFNNPQGLACVRLRAWEDTSRTEDDDEVTVYGINSGDKCLIYNRSMYSLGIYGLADGHIKFEKPWAVAADENGRVYVTDRLAGRVVELWNDGKDLHLRRFVGEGELLDPYGAALDAQGNLYVTDAGAGSIAVFDSSGAFVNAWNGFVGPSSLAVTSPGEAWSFYPDDGFLVVIDSLHQRISRLSLSGRLEAVATAKDINAPGARLAWVAMDFHNNLLITDSKGNRIHKLTRDLTPLTSFGAGAVPVEPLDEPRGIAVYRRFGQVFIAEREGARYLWVAVDVNDFRARVRAQDEWRDLDIDFHLTEPALAQIDVLDKQGRFVARIYADRRIPAGDNRISWALVVPKAAAEGTPADLPGALTRGDVFPRGEYLVRAQFRATYSSREHFFRQVEASFTVP